MLLGSFIWIYDDDEEEEDGEAESSIHRMGSTKSRHGTGRPARSSTLMSADQIPRTIPGVMETAPSRGHSRQNTLESAASTSPQHHNQVQQWYRP
jgi:hypothetical protein